LRFMKLPHEHAQSAGDIRRRRAASRDLSPGLALLVLSQASLIAKNPDAAAGDWYTAWALSPLIGLGLVTWAQVRILRRADERERAQELFAMAIGFGVVMFALAGVGVLHAAAIGQISQQLQITTGLGIATWLVASQVLRRATS